MWSVIPACLARSFAEPGQRNFIAILQAYVAVQRQVGSRTNLRLTACSVHCNVPCCGKRTICTNQSTIRNLQCGPLRNVDGDIIGLRSCNGQRSVCRNIQRHSIQCAANSNIPLAQRQVDISCVCVRAKVVLERCRASLFFTSTISRATSESFAVPSSLYITFAILPEPKSSASWISPFA